MLPSGTTVSSNPVTGSGADFEAARGVTIDAGSSFNVINGNYVSLPGTGTDVAGTMNIGGNIGSSIATNILTVETTGTVNINGVPGFYRVDSLVNNGHLNISSSGGVGFRGASPTGTYTNNGTVKVTGTTMFWGVPFINNARVCQ